MKRFWMVYREGGNMPTFKHPSQDAAITEAIRLAKLNPDSIFHVLGVEKSVRKIEVHIHDHMEAGDQPPF